VLGFAGVYGAVEALRYMPIFFETAVGPLVMLYYAVLTKQQTPKAIKYSMFIPLTELIYRVVLYCLPSTSQDWWVLHWHEPIFDSAFTLVAVALIATSVIWVFVMNRQYNQWLADNSSVKTDLDTSWLSHSLWLLLMIALYWAYIDITDIFITILNHQAEYPFYFTLGISVFLLSQIVISQGERTYPKMPQTAMVQYNQNYNLQQASEIISSFKAKELYLKPRLSLVDVTSSLAIGEDELAQAIRLSNTPNFNQFVNYFRVEKAKQDLRQTNGDILSIALESGFNSKASFNRVFKDYVNQTPSEFRKASR